MNDFEHFIQQLQKCPPKSVIPKSVDFSHAIPLQCLVCLMDVVHSFFLLKQVQFHVLRRFHDEINSSIQDTSIVQTVLKLIVFPFNMCFPLKCVSSVMMVPWQNSLDPDSSVSKSKTLKCIVYLSLFFYIWDHLIRFWTNGKMHQS